MNGFISNSDMKELLCKPLLEYEPWMDWVLVAAISAPHFLYAFLWFFPKAWQSVFGRQATEAFAMAGAIGKGMSTMHSRLQV